jgi:Ca2+-binding RTX toxin-like protein
LVLATFSSGVGSRITNSGGNFIVTSYSGALAPMATGMGIEKIVGSSAADSIIGFADVAAGTGNDLVFGSTANDALYGEDGNDQITGNAGDDLIDGGLGNDNLIGELGNDTVRGGDGDDSVRGASGDDSLFGDNGNDLVIGDEGIDTLDGGAGDDRLIGGLGADTINGGAGNDTVDYTGSSSGVSTNLQTGRVSGGDAAGDTLISIENVTGSALADTLIGNGSANVLSGAAGNDTLNGGAGADLLSGGAGQDTFVFKTSGEIGSFAFHDQVLDFEAGGSTLGSRIDVFDLSGIDAIAKTTTKDDAFTFIGSAAFSGKAGELKYELVSGVTYVEGDTNGDGVADFYLQVAVTGTLDASDFIL